VFDVDLATSLAVLSVALSAKGDHTKGCTTIEEAIRVLTPHFRKYPQAQAGLISEAIRVYMDMVKKLDQKPDAELLRPLTKVFEKLKEQQTEEQDQ